MYNIQNGGGAGMAKRKVDGDTANSLVPAGARSAPGSLVDPALLEQLLHILHAAGQVANRVTALKMCLRTTAVAARKTPCAVRPQNCAILRSTCA
jgi:hypothetical protein